MSEGQSPDRLTPEDLLPPPEAAGPVGPREKRARDMATMVALLGLVLVAGGLMAILALVFNQLLIFAFLAAIVLGGGIPVLPLRGLGSPARPATGDAVRSASGLTRNGSANPFATR